MTVRSPFPPRHPLDDPASRRVIDALDAVGDGRSTVTLPTMSPAFRDELRTQLVAVAPRLIADGVAGESATGTAPMAVAGVPDTGRRSRRSLRSRPLTVLVAGAAVVILGLGGATWLSRDALPGDALYGLKRTTESVGVSLSDSDLDRGHALLVGASTRVQEVDDLLARPQAIALGAGPAGPDGTHFVAAGGGVDAETVTLIVDTLETADSDTHRGIATIGDDAVDRDDTAGLELVVGWAQGQRDAIDALLARIPAGAALEQAKVSAQEIRAGLTRAELLLADVQGGVTCDRSRDAFGPLPCAG